MRVALAGVALAALPAACASVLSPPFDAERLSAATTPDQVRAELPSDELLVEAATCASGGQPDTLDRAAMVHDVCGLEDLATSHDFSVATGDRMLAARAFLWLREHDPVEAVRVGRVLLGPPAIPEDADPPVLEGLRAVPLGVVTRVDAPIRQTGAWGPFPYWHVEGFEGVDTVLADKDLDVGTLRHVLASAGGRVQLVVRSDRISSIPLIAVRGGDLPSGLGPVPEHGELATFSPPDEQDLQSFVDAIAGQAVREAPIALVIGHRPCGPAPAAGMHCVPGHGEVGRFWIDEVPTSDTAACYRRGACRSVPGTWAAARELCSYLGKRLPTWWEAERAGLDGPATWTGTWVGPEGPGQPPRGVCDGSPYCRVTATRRLSDGSDRPFQQPLKAPIRCATDLPWLTDWPPLGWDRLPPEPTLPDPDPDAAALAAAITPDPLDAKGVCGEEVRETWIEDLRRGGRSTTECRDPQSYVTSNEPDRFLFGRLVRNLGGAYVGVGSDQSYDFISAARSEWAWVYDYDPNVVRLHRISQPLLRAAETRQDYVALWDDPERALPLIQAAFDPDRAAVLMRFYGGWHRRLHRHYSRQLAGHPEQADFGWLATDRNYTWIRTLAQQDRIIPTPLDLLGTRGLRSVGAQARAMGVPVRVFYTSNAPTAWGGQATPDYKKNLLALPFDDRTRVLQTTNRGAFDQEGRWHYNVMDGLLFQRRMASEATRWNHQHMWDRIPGDHGNLTVLGLRGEPGRPGATSRP